MKFDTIIASFIILPLISAVAVVLSPQMIKRWIPAFGGFLILMCGMHAYNQSGLSPIFSHEIRLGGFRKPYAIELKIDSLRTIVLIVCAFAFLITEIANYCASSKTSEEDIRVYAPCLRLMALAGCMGMVITNDIFTSYVFLELLSLSSAALFASTSNKQSYKHALDYLIFSGIAGGFYLIGVCLLYFVSGYVGMQHLGRFFSVNAHSLSSQLAQFLIALSLIIKAGMFIFVEISANAYKSANFPNKMFIMAVVSKVFVLTLVRIVTSLNYTDMNSIALGLKTLIYSTIFFTSLWSAVKALKCQKLLDVAIYSSIFQSSYMLLPLLVANKYACAGFILQLISQTLSSLILMLGAWCMQIEQGSDNLHELHKANWAIKLSIIMAILNSIGVPVLIGFFAKWNILWSVISIQDWLFLLYILLSSLTTLIYSLRILGAIITRESTEGIDLSPSILSNGLYFRLIMIGLSLLMIAFVLYDWRSKNMTHINDLCSRFLIK